MRPVRDRSGFEREQEAGDDRARDEGQREQISEVVAWAHLALQ